MNADGVVKDGFEGVPHAFVEAQAGGEGGAQLCVYHRGEMVVDLWCGRDNINDRPLLGDTIAVLMSSTKGMTATGRAHAHRKGSA